MCGRTSCCLRPEVYEYATSYYDPSADQHKKPTYHTSINFEFKPSSNIAPSEVSPVLVWDQKERAPVLKPMVWGLIPQWADNNFLSSKYHTHNCRLETVKESSLYRPQLKQGRRCVVVCEGYYEWQTVGSKNKSPAFIYIKQPEGIKVEEVSSWENGYWSHESGWTGPSLTCMAGLYSITESSLKGVITSYTVLTMAASNAVKWLHHRMPAILSTPDEIMNWLNYEDIDEPEALSLLHQTEAVNWHRVSSAVNNSRYKGPDCNKPVEEKKDNQTTLSSWFSKASVKRSNPDSDDPSLKKIKN